jgi:hypothetical protein
MCTVTVVRVGDLLRVVSNRDEMRSRPPAHAPRIVRAGAQHALMPHDPQGGGTWIAVNSSGLVFVLLNLYDEPASGRSASSPSRGLIIPSLVDCESLSEIAKRVDVLGEPGFAPCRLIVADDRAQLEIAIRRDSIRATGDRRDRALMFASSDLGDVVVDGPRRILFEQMMTGDLVTQQDAFHAHRWRDRPAVSVHMSRPYACTVSTTTVEVTRRAVRMVYQPAHCDAGTAVGLVLDREPHVSAAWSRREYAAV